MSSLPGPVTNCTTGAIEGPSAINPEKFPLGVVGSELNSSFPDVDEFLISIEDLITVPAESTSGACRQQPSVAGGGTGMYTCPVNKVGSLEELMMTKQLVGSTHIGPTFTTSSLPLSIAGHTGVDGCTTSSSGAKYDFESAVGAPEGCFSVESMHLQSVVGNSGGRTYPGSNPNIKDDDIYDLEDVFLDHIIGFDK
ncbi:hypothetical protein K7X08_028522 [Anisodus acutangulus]|uniref:Uncharacterized protein n=1 Tax=Anisodus acutangulus TaxID=402998 RepID=A0A9Q1M988_9SOLA|nr:hypothetical protein K7X08_028522 [Anisodus acutangulus]